MIPKALFNRFKANPIGFVKRVLYKYTWGAFKYKTGDDYNASKYWDDRFSKFHHDILGPGDEALNLEQNNEMYQICKDRFLQLCDNHNIDLKTANILEIGIGNGFYTQILKEKGVTQYQGADITDVLFKQHQTNFPEFKFSKIDITQEPITGKYDLILLIDVIQHIVKEEKLKYAFSNIAKALNPGGCFMLTPVLDLDKRHFFYLKSWSKATILGSFQNFEMADEIPFKDSSMMLLKKPMMN